MSMLERMVSCLSPTGFHKMAYVEWPGPPGAPTVVCVHGLTRNGRDFDALARVLSRRRRVVCPDIVGRGRSDWLANGAYGYPQYLADMTALIARLDVETVEWVGTSMGGLIGMMMAALPGTPVTRLVINDIGPLIPRAALERIGSYVGTDPSFPDTRALEMYLRQIHAPFGPLSDEGWAEVIRHGHRRKPDGTVGLAYDPRIGDALRAAGLDDIQIWDTWDRIKVPTLVLRGAVSDLLLAETAAAMRQRGPRADIVEFAGIGHAPWLVDPEQTRVIDRFLAD